MKKEIKNCCEVMGINKQRMNIKIIFHNIHTNSYSFHIEGITMSHCPWCGTKLELEPEEEMETWYQYKLYHNTLIETCLTLSNINNKTAKILSTKSVTVPKGTLIEEIYKLLTKKENEE